jgi:SAM-dependent methyltransferase
MTSWAKYSDKARDWSERQYADAEAYLRHRAELVRALGPPLEPGDVVLDLACGDGALGDFLVQQRYVGVDGNEEMVDAGRGRGREIVLGDLNDYVPGAPVTVTTIFRAVYYANDRRALFTSIRGYTERKLVFDLNPRQYRLDDIRADLESAGFSRLDTQPFFVPQTRSVPFLTALERSGPLAQLLLRYRFTVLCAAFS